MAIPIFLVLWKNGFKKEGASEQLENCDIIILFCNDFQGTKIRWSERIYIFQYLFTFIEKNGLKIFIL